MCFFGSKWVCLWWKCCVSLMPQRAWTDFWVPPSSQSFHCVRRGRRKGRVPRHVPPSDISTGLGARLQRGCCGDHTGYKRQKPFHPTAVSDSQQASAQSDGGVWPCWRQAGGTKHRWGNLIWYLPTARGFYFSTEVTTREERISLRLGTLDGFLASLRLLTRYCMKDASWQIWRRSKK